MRHSRQRLVVAAAFLLILAACGGGTGAATGSTATSQGTTSSSAASSSSTTSSTTTTTEAAPPMSVELQLTEIVPADPDPLETILPLDGVTVSMSADGKYVFTFAAAEHGGIGVQVAGVADGVFASCDWKSVDEFPGDGEGTGCFWQSSEGFDTAEPVSNGDAPTQSVVVMLEVTIDSVTLIIGEDRFTGTGLRFDDGPLFVQIDPNTGGLAEPVTRRTGEIGAADLYTALNG
jgi:hypothetical protein